MNIQRVILVAPPPSRQVSILLADGSIWQTDASLPADTDLRAALAEWLAEGGEPEPFVAPAAPVVLPSPREFMDRLSMARQAEITAAATQSPELLLWLLRMTGAREVDPAHAETIAGVQALRQVGVITEAEAAALLAPGGAA